MIDRFTKEYRWLSNFWPVYITFEGIIYPSVEHAYQAAKSTDGAYRFYVQTARDARAAKAVGALVVCAPEWNKLKYGIMVDLVWQKFQTPYLQQKLLATGSADIVEGNYWHDIYWGVCSCAIHRGEGQNNLGMIIMQTRKKLHEVLHAKE